MPANDQRADSDAGEGAPVREHESAQREFEAPQLPGLVAPRSRLERWAPKLIIGILLLAAGLRFVGLNWDDGHHLHPDERFITMVAERIRFPASIELYFDTAKSPFNPYNRDFGSYIYGTFPLFFVRGVAETIAAITNALPLPTAGPVGEFFRGWRTAAGYGEITLIGRALSGVADLLTILLIFFIGRRLYSVGVGLLAALLAALTVLQIQAAHFFTAEGPLTLIITLAFYLAIRAAETNSLRIWALFGLATGLAVATKINALLFGAVVLTAAGLLWYRTTRDQETGERRRFAVEDTITLLAVVGVMVFLTFRLTQPYAFSGPGLFDFLPNPKYLGDLQTWQRFASGENDYPPSHQWAGSEPYIWQLRNMTLWGMGPTLTIAGWLGFFLAAIQFLRNPRKYDIHVLALVWVGLNFVYWGAQFTKPMRYLLPIYPQLALFAAFFLVSAWQWARQAQRPSMVQLRRVAAGALTFAVIGWTAFYAFAFASIYTKPTTRVAASEWFYENAPPGSKIAWEHWDDPLPLRLAGKDAFSIYKGVEMPMYDLDSVVKRNQVISKLDEADFVVLSSNRLYGSIPKLPLRYPMTTRYYQALFSGELGFEQVGVFTSRPQLFGIELNDDNAEEIFTVYEHPRVDIFRKSPTYSTAQVRSILEAVNIENVIATKPLQVRSTGLLQSAAAVAATRVGGTWSAIFDRDSVANSMPLLSWYLALQLLALLALPLTWFVFRRLADGGYALAKTLAVLVIAYVPWLLASYQILPYATPAIWLSVGLLAALSAIVVARERGTLLSSLRQRWRPILGTEALFAVGFLGFALLRAWNPDLWHPAYGGEKPMDFAYLNAVIKTTYFPPYDPWFSGGFINYYYFGQVIVGSLIKLTGIVPWVAYNLAIPTIAALTMINVASLVYNLLISKAGAKASRQVWALGAGVLGAVMATVLGNLHGVVQIVEYLGKLDRSPFESAIPGLAGTLGALRGAIVWVLAMGQGLPNFNFNFWDPTRVIITEPTAPITEFPYFTFLYGDLHAHMISMPFQLLAMAIALNLLRQQSWVPSLGGLTGRGKLAAIARAAVHPGGLTILLGGLTIGVLRMTNSWDYPTYLGLVCVAVLLSEALRPNRDWTTVAVRGVILAGVVVVSSSVLISPFVRNFELFYTGFEPAPGHTMLHHYLIILGVFLAVLTTYLAFQFSALRRRLTLGIFGALGTASGAPTASGVAAVGTLNVIGWVDRLAVALAALAGFVAILLLVAGLPVVGVAGALIAALLLVAVLRPQSPGMRFTFLLGATALALTAGVELVTLKGDIGRMNTVFKFYLQVWLMLSVVSAVLLALLARRAWGSRWLLKGPRRIVAIALVALIALTALYPLLGTPSKMQHRFAFFAPTLDGMEFMRVARYEDKDRDLLLPDDYKGINWMLDNVQGTPVIVEALSPLYHWRSRVAVWTGLPAVIGWDWHQKQQRGDYAYMIDTRVKDVDALFTTQDQGQAKTLLDKYDVSYIFVGGQERAFYPVGGIEKFERMVGSSLERAYQGGVVTIYRVVR